MTSIGIELDEKEYIKIPLWKRLLHNIRKHKTNSSIFSQKDNFYILNDELKDMKIDNDSGKNYFEEETERLKKVVKDKTKQKSKNKNHIVESVIAISNDDEIKGWKKSDFEKKLKDYIEYLEKVEKVKVYSGSFHFDEGHYIDKKSGRPIPHLDDNGKQLKDFKFDNETMKKVRNIHYHIIHSNINEENGRSLTKQYYQRTENYNKENGIQKYIFDIETKKPKPNPNFLKGLSLLQNKVSEIFGLKRGVVNSKHKHNRNYKNDRIEETTKLNNLYNNAMKKINELTQKINNKENELTQTKETINKLNVQITDLTNENQSKDTELIETKEKINELNGQITDLENKIKELEKIIDGYKNRKEKIVDNKTLSNEDKKLLHKFNKSIYDLSKKILNTTNLNVEKMSGVFIKDKELFKKLTEDIEKLNKFILSKQILEVEREEVLQKTQNYNEEEDRLQNPQNWYADYDEFGNFLKWEKIKK